MIIQCDTCQTKFRLDDSKVKDSGVKVRCAKCRNVFTVFREVPVTAPPADFGGMLDNSVASGTGFPDVTAAAEQPAEEQAQEQAQEQTPEFGVDESVEDDGYDETGEFDSSAFGIAPDESEDMPPEETGGDSAELPLFGDAAPRDVPEDVQSDSDEIDFGGFDFGEAAAPAEQQDGADSTFDFGVGEVAPAAPAAPVKKEYGGLDFSDDDMFGEVVPQAPEEAAPAITFDLGMDGFADAMKNDDGAGSQKGSFGGDDLSMDNAFSLDEIDFGDDLTAVAIQHVNPEELKPSQEILFGPLAEAQAKSETAAGEEFFAAAPAAAPEELPPLPIASRRKQGPFSSAMIAAVGVVVIGVVALIGYMASSGNNQKSGQESGAIAVRDVNATYVKNKLTGDLLVISGEVVNEYSKPRAAIQVKGMVYGADGKVISSKNAFCGNPLTPQQLSTMPLDQIEAAMANQFGDSLANMEVPPGKAIPFVIVMTKPDKAARDYGVEPAGSTVAAGKM